MLSSTQFVDDNMSGNYSIVYVYDSGEPDGVKNPEVLREIERVQKEAEKHPLVTKTYSVVDMMKDINESFHNGDPAYYRIPESRDLVAQYLLVYEMSGGEELRDQARVLLHLQHLALRVRVALLGGEEDERLGAHDDHDGHRDQELEGGEAVYVLRALHQLALNVTSWTVRVVPLAST